MADDAATKKKATDDAEAVVVAAAFAWPTGGYEMRTFYAMRTVYSWIGLIGKVLIFPTDGTAVVKPSGLLELTNGTTQLSSHVVHRSPLRLRRSPGNGVRSFSASFVFGIIPPANNGNATNHIFSVELDTIQSKEFQDPDDNHVGIDANSLQSIAARHAGYYYDKTDAFHDLLLISGKAMQV
ncbi:hypothetical protein VPH35_100086 [Triticum aestivum]